MRTRTRGDLCSAAITCVAHASEEAAPVKISSGMGNTPRDCNPWALGALVSISRDGAEALPQTTSVRPDGRDAMNGRFGCRLWWLSKAVKKSPLPAGRVFRGSTRDAQRATSPSDEAAPMTTPAAGSGSSTPRHRAAGSRRSSRALDECAGCSGSSAKGVWRRVEPAIEYSPVAEIVRPRDGFCGTSSASGKFNSRRRTSISAAMFPRRAESVFL